MLQSTFSATQAGLTERRALPWRAAHAAGAFTRCSARKARAPAAVLGLLCWVMGSASALAALDGLPTGVTRVHQLEGVTEYRLANGLQVLLAPDDSKPTTTVNVTYRVGSRMESYGETGMAHLLEHLLFKGTPQHKDIPAELSRRGMRPNGTTWYDRTNYFETFAASPQNLDWALAMEADRMVNSFVARRALDSEMTVVRNEMEKGENEPEEVLSDKVMAAAFQWHNYGKATIGARADVENVNIAHLQAFYHKYYQPDNATLVVAGSFDPLSTLRRIQGTFGKITRPQRKLEPTWTLDPAQDGERLVVLRRVGEVPIFQALYHAVAAADPDSAAFELLAQVLGDTPSGRLYQALVAKGLATQVESEYYRLAEPGATLFQTDVPKGKDPEVTREAFLATLEQLHQHPLTDQEVNRARASLLNDFNLTFNDPEHFGIALSGAIADGDWRLFFLNRDRLKSIDTARVQQVAESWLMRSNRTLGEFIPTAHPTRAPAPQRADAATQLKNYADDTTVMGSERFDASAANLQRRTHWYLYPDGLRVAALPKKTRGAVVHAQIQLRFGDAATLFGKEQIGAFAAALLDKGAGAMDRQTIQDLFTALQAHVAFGGGATGATVTIQTDHSDLPAVLTAVAQILRHPNFPEAELDQSRAAAMAELDQSRNNPQALASNAVHRAFNQYPRGDLRYSSTFDETAADLKSVSLDQVRKFYQDFYGANHAQVAVVGDFAEEQVLRTVLDGLADWRSDAPYAVVVEEFHEFPAQRIVIDTPDKANAMFYLRQAVPLKDDDPRAQALVLGNYILGEGFLNSRLATRIRQQDGLSYGVGSFLRLNDQVPNSAFGVYAIYAPQNRAHLERDFKEVIATTRDQGFTAKEIDAAKTALLQSRELARAQDGVLAAQLTKLMFEQRDFRFVQEQDERLQALDREEVNQALRQFVSPEHFIAALAGEFGKLP